MRKISIACFFVLLSLSSLLVYAHGEEDFAQAEKWIQSKISCDELADEQLELIGDYYMEQIHPGELHEIMDQRMGGEGSETLRQVHINMALNFYCGERQAMPAEMMNMMVGRTQGGMMSMMGYGNGFGMMGYGGYWGFYQVLIWVLLIGLIILVYLWVWKLWKGMKKQTRR